MFFLSIPYVCAENSPLGTIRAINNSNSNHEGKNDCLYAKVQKYPNGYIKMHKDFKQQFFILVTFK